MPASRSGITSCSRYARGSASSMATSASETGTGDCGRQWRASWTSIRTPYSPFVLKEMAPEAWNVRTLRVWSSRCWSGGRADRGPVAAASGWARVRARVSAQFRPFQSEMVHPVARERQRGRKGVADRTEGRCRASRHRTRPCPVPGARRCLGQLNSASKIRPPRDAAATRAWWLAAILFEPSGRSRTISGGWSWRSPTSRRSCFRFCG